MLSVLYCHGFASSPLSAKVTSLRPLLEPHRIELNVPDLNVPSFERLDFDAVVAHAVECELPEGDHSLAGHAATIRDAIVDAVA